MYRCNAHFILKYHQVKALAKIGSTFIVKSHNIFPIITNSVDEFLFIRNLLHTKIIHLYKLIKNVQLMLKYSNRKISLLNWGARGTYSNG